MQPDGRSGRGGGGDDAAAAPPRRVRRPAAAEEHLEIMLSAARSAAGGRPRAPRRSAGPRQDQPRRDRRRRDGRALQPRAAPRSNGRATSPRSSRTSTTATCCSSTRSTGCRATVEEVLYPAMEDFQLDIVIGKGPSARSIRLDLPALHARRRDHPHRAHHRPAARPLRLRRPPRLLRARRARGDPARAARILGVPLDADGAERDRAARRGTPRIANRLLKRVRDYAEVRADGTRRPRHARDALALFEVDELGLDKVDRAILARAVRHVRAAAGRARHAGGRGGRGARDGRGRLRAVPAAVRPARAHAARAGWPRPPRFAHLGLHAPPRRARLRASSERSGPRRRRPAM